MTYERPEIMEVGQAQTLTLGTTGVNTDNCGCSVPRIQPGLEPTP